MLRAHKDFLNVEIPACDRDLCLNVHLGFIELVLPFFEHSDALLDDVDGLGDGLLLENGLELNMLANFRADFVGDCFEDLLKLGIVLVDVARDRPNQLEAI